MPDKTNERPPQRRRYYSQQTLREGGPALIGGPEAHHLAHVLRARAGTEVTLFDGHGGEYQATIERIGRAEIALVVDRKEEIERELPHPLFLGVALPKVHRHQWLIEKAVELGVTRLTPLLTQFSDRSQNHRLDRLGRYVIEASKQCGRNRLMEITPPQGWDEWLAAAESGQEGVWRRWVAHPGGDPLATLLGAAPGPRRLAVGPEGGLSSAEAASALEAGWELVDLGERILRIETAALVLASWAAL